MIERAAQQLFPRFYASRHPAVLALRWTVVFHGVCFAWIFFRAASFGDAWTVMGNIAQLLSAPFEYTALISFFMLFALAHWSGNRYQTKDKLADAPAWICGTVLGLALCLLWVYTPAEHKAFIYFQF